MMMVQTYWDVCRTAGDSGQALLAEEQNSKP